MTGQRDYLLRIVVRDLEAYERFLKDKLMRAAAVLTVFDLKVGPTDSELYRDRVRPSAIDQTTQNLS